MRRSRSILVVAIAIVSMASLGAPCGFNSLSIDAPGQGVILDADPVLVSARIGASFNPLTFELFLDNVELLSALGLTPPFSGAGGVVNIGGDLVTVSNFSVPINAGIKFISLELSDLDTDEHALVARVERPDTTLVERARTFTFVDFFTQELQILGAAGLEEPVQSEPGGSILANATLGDPFAAPPVALTDGGTLRQGFVEAAEGVIAGAP